MYFKEIVNSGKRIPKSKTKSFLRNLIITAIVILALVSTLEAQVTVDATSSTSIVSSATSITLSHTTGSGSDRLMLVGISTRDKTVSGTPTYGGTNLTLVGSQTSNNNAKTYIYRLIAPATGTANVVINFSGDLTKGAVVGVMTFTGVHQTTPLGTYASAQQKSATASVSVSSAASELVFNVMSVKTSGASVGSGQTQRWYVNTTNECTGGGSTKTGAATTSMSWSLSASNDWSMSAVPIKPLATTDLQITKTINDNTPDLGQSVTFTLTASNSGPDNATNVNVQDLLPNGFTYVSHSTATGTYTPGTGVWAIGNLNNGSSATLTITATVSCNLEYKNIATITGNQPDPDAGNNTAIVVVNPQNTLSTTYYVCPGGTVDFSGIAPCNTPGGSVSFTWHSGTPATDGNEIADVTALGEGTYYAAFHDHTNTCYSPTTMFQVIEYPEISASLSHDPILCYGATTTLTVTASGGSGTLQFSLNDVDYQAGNTFTVGAGTYTVFIKDDNCTKSFGPYTITQPTQVVLSVLSKTNILCYGNTTGAISVKSTGGTPPYTYSLDDADYSNTTGVFTGLAANTYTVHTKDANNCGPFTQTVVVSQPSAPLDVQTAITQPSCYLQGKILLTVTGGTAPYTYDWADLPGTNNPKDRTGLEDGTYTVTVTDKNGCTFVSGPHTLTNADAPCLGTTVCSTDGAYKFSTDPDPANVLYTWRIEDLSDNSDQSVWITSGQGTPNIVIDWTSAADGGYLVCVIAENDCGSTTEICKTVYVNSAIASASLNSICEGGDLQLFASGGESYVWSGPDGFSSSSANPVIYNVTSANAGLYTVTVTTSRGCQSTADVTVTLGTPPSLSTSVTDATCGQADGAIDLTVTPAGVYTFLWSNGSTDEDLTNIPAGNYTVTVTNAGGCEVVLTVSVNNSDGPSISGNVTNIECYGDNTGEIDATVTGGTGPYSYSWSNGSTDEDLTGLAAGEYLLTVTDATGCNAFYNVTLTEPNPLNLDYTKVDVLCNGGATGSINLVVTGGTGVYSFSWDKDSTPYSTDEDLTTLGAGLYEVTVTDANSCVATISVTITEPAQALSATATADPMVSCFGGSDGYIGLSVAGGTEPYTYAWTGPGVFTATTKNIQDLIAGTYEVTITDANGCTFSTNATVTEPAAALAVSSFTKDDVSCFGGNDGSIDIEVAGGTGPYTYVWSNGAGTQDLSGLVVGSYTVIVTDSKGCTTTETYNITQPNALTASISKTDVDCYGASTGAIDLTISGGTGPYSVLWSNLAVTEDLTNIAAGYYSVLITDANGCEFSTNTTLTQPTDILITGTITNVLCNGASTGAITVSVSGGTGAYSYEWLDGPTDQNRSGLTAGDYTLTVKDAANCEKTAVFTISEPAALSLSTIVSNISCNGGSDGSINLTVSGGVGPYTFSWSTGATSEDISGLTASNSYSVTVTDANLCVATLSGITVTEPDELTLIVSKNNDVTCKDGSDGSATATPSGGTPPYSYLWSNGSTLQTPLNFGAGSYTVVVTDSKGCIANGNVSITEPTEKIELYAVVKNNNACGNPASGAIDLTVVNGTGLLTYTWSNGFTDEDPTGLAAGTYNVTVTDALGCSETLSGITVGTADALVVSVEAFDRTCLAADGSAYAIVEGGTPPYTYVWSNSATTSFISGLDVNTYSVTVTDADGCIANASGAVGSPSCLPPVAVNDYTSTLGETPVYGNVSFNDSDGDHLIGELEFLPLDIPAPEVGTLDWGSSADGSFVFTPAPGFSGTVTIRYIVEDPTGLQDEGLLTIYVYGVPVAVDDVNTTFTDSPVSGNVLTNDWDPKDRPLTTTPETKTTANGGTVVISANGNYIYTPPTGYTGEDTFTYEVCDNNAPPSCNNATVTIEVLPMPTAGNDPPVAANDAYQMTVSSTLSGQVLENDFDVDGDALNVQSGTADTDGDGNPDALTLATPTNVYGTNVNGDIALAGQLTLNADGTFTFIADANFSGSVEVGYLNTDGVLTDDAKLVILVLPTQNLTNTTFAINDNNSIEMNTAVSGNVLDNDFDLEGHTQTVSSPGTYATANGSITISANGDYTYTPNAGYTGQDSYTYTVCDDGTPQACDQGVLTINVYEITSNNDPPVALSDAFIGNGNATVTGSVLDNDFDLDGNLDPNSVTLVGPAPNTATEGTLILNADGTFSFVPVLGFSGDVTFRYQVCDTDGTPLCDESDVTITILAMNSTFATDDVYYLLEDGSLSGNVLNNDNDPEGNTQTVSLVSGPTHGTLVLNANGTFTFEPNPNYNGTDQFVYQVCDDGTPQACDNSTVYLNVLGVNDPPIAIDDINTTFKNTAAIGNVLTNDSDPEGDNLTVTTQTNAATTAGGTVTLNADGTYTYTPPSNFVGEDTFTYEVCDDGTPVECSNATVTIKVIDRATALNDPPIAVNDHYQGILNYNVTGNVLSNDMDPDADPLVVNSALVDTDGDGNVDDALTIGSSTQIYGKDNIGNDVNAGTLTMSADGTFTFVPETGFLGKVTYTYEVCDNGTPALCDNATVTIDMLANPDAGNSVFALNDAVSTPINTAATGNVIANDYDPQGNNMTITNTGTFATANGSITIAADGSYIYTPNTDFTGTDSYTYTVCDDGTPQACDYATLAISVYENTGANDEPVAMDDAFYTGKNSTLSGNVMTNDSDPDGNLDPNSVTLVSGGSAVDNGTLVLNTDGTFSYEPNPGFTGNVFFTYQVCDTDGTPLCDQATVYIDVIGGNSTFAVDDSYLGIDVVTMAGNVLDNDYDPEGDNQSVSLVSGVINGVLVLNPDGSFTYTPNSNFKGTDTFVYKVCDDGNTSVCDYATVYLNVGKRTKSCLISNENIHSK